jgi:hypothetical protein
MEEKSRNMRFHVLAGLLTITAAAAFAQADPPSRVARLNFIQGAVSFRPAGVDDWTAATLNYPLNTGDYLWADQGARAELHVGSTAVRMDQTTAISVVNLNDQLVQLSLTAGSVNVHIRYLGQNENFEVDTPNVAIMLLRPGDYRINADGDNSVTGLVVHSGDAEVTAGASGAFNVRNGQMARLTGAQNPQQELSGAPPLDAFDGWASQRDASEDRATQSARYVPREMIGYEDLDANGRWVNIPPYGMVWQPTAVAVGWAPYRQGHWAWVEPWGWTWIDDMPWGFAPFHYGRWAFAAGGWYWVPGAVAVRPVYSPALVAFVGGGGIGVGVAAWFPLGPGEVYRPAYAVTDIYVRNVNVAYVSNVAVISRVQVGPVVYMNQRVAGAVTIVPHDVFVGARPVAVAAVAVTPTMLVSARVVGYTAAIAPERVSVLARPIGGAVIVRTPPVAVVQRVVVARNVPPPPPVAFVARQEALRQNPGRPLDAAQLNAIRASQPQRASFVRPIGQPAGFGRSPNAPPVHNDRPPGAMQPHPAAAAERPAERPAEARSNEARPANEARPNENRPANDAHNEHAQDQKHEEKGKQTKKNDRTDKDKK